MENNFELPPKIKRVDNLRETDKPGEDSVGELAYKEDEFRNGMPKSGKLTGALNNLLEKSGIKYKLGKGMSQEEINQYADKISDETLGKMEAEKQAIEAQKLALVDSLTGLRTRRAFDEKLSSMFAISESTPKDIKERRKIEERRKKDRRHLQFSVVMADIDHFKSVNDTYGHPIGDKILRGVSQIIQEQLRHEDLPYRYGGEEIVILLPDTNLELAKQVAERIRRAVEEKEFEIGEGNKLHVTISLGCGNIKDVPEGTKSEDIAKFVIDEADSALYKAKGKGGEEGDGRNRTVVYKEGMEKEENN